MQILYNPEGTHLHKEALKVRLDFYPDVIDKSYQQHYVCVPIIPDSGYPGKKNADGDPTNQSAYDLWLDGLPHIWQLNPCLCVFVRVDQNITLELIQDFIRDVYKPDVLATIDNALTNDLSAHLISPYMRNKTTLSTTKTLTFDTQTKSYLDARLSSISVIGKSGGKSQEIQPQSIDIGPGAIDRLYTFPTTYTSIDVGNPANDTGILDTFEAWFNSDATGTKIGTFSGSGTSYTPRDYESIGNVTSGSKQTFTGLSCNVTTDDVIGYYAASGAIDRDDTGGTGLYFKADDQFEAGTQTYTLNSSSKNISLYGTGSSPPTDYPITLSASMSVSPSIVRSWSKTFATSSPISMATSLTKSLASTRISNSLLSMSSSLTRNTTTDRTTTSNISLTSSVVRNIAKAIASTVNLTVDTSVLRLFRKKITSSANLALSTSLTSLRSWTRALATNLSLSSSLTRNTMSTRAIDSGLSLTASLVRVLDKYIITTVNLSVQTTVSRSKSILRAITVNISLASSLMRTVAKNIRSTVNLSVAISLTKSFGRAITSTVNLSVHPVLSRKLASIRLVTSNLAVSVSVTKVKGYVKTITSNLSMAVSLSPSWWSAFVARRFFKQPSTTYGSDVPKTGRYGSQE